MVPAFLLLNRMASRRRALLLNKTQRPMKAYKEASKKEFCRTCLSSKNLECIFSEVQCEEKRSEDLQLVTGLEIKLNDGLSQKICTRCLKTIDLALRFRRVSKKTEKALLNMTVKTKKVSKASKCIQKAKHVITKTESDSGELDNDYGDIAFDDDCQNYDCSDLYNSYQEDEEPRDDEKPSERGRRKSRIPNASSYKCNTCNKEFRMKTTYTAHMRFHTNYCVCEVCGKRCRNNNQLQEHKRARHGMGRIHKCAYCEYSSATKEALVIHERRHTGERPYVCDHCGATFHRRSNLVQHIAIHLPEKNFQCDMCPKRLKSKKFLQIHKHNAHTGKRYGYLCSVCDHRFEKPNKVRAHTRRVHGLPDEQQGPIVDINDTLPQEMCSTCINFVNESIQFRRKCEESQKILLENKHSVIKVENCFKSEENSISIDISDSFEDDFKDYDDNITLDTLQYNKTSENLKANGSNKHKNNIKLSRLESVENNTKLKKNGKIDKREKRVREKIECEYCHKILTSRLSLRNHYKIHTGFDVVCEHCGKKFITRRLLLMHCRAKHGYEKTDKCSFCDYRASNAEQVKIHERLHTGEKPFVCKECNAGFHRKSSYLQHIAIHLPEKTVQCDQCPARFKSVTLMRIHKNRHRPSPYSFMCGVCDNSFVRRRNVVRHLMRVHGVEGESHVRRVRVT